MRLIRSILTSLVFGLPGIGLAHEFWLEPDEYQSKAGSEMAVRAYNGQDFKGTELSWFDRRIDRVSVILNREGRKYNGLPGDLPAISVTLNEGLTVISYASTMSKLTYESWEKTLNFASSKGVEDFERAHAARGLPRDGVTEGYWRFAKTLLAGGSGAGTDGETGLPTEFVMLTNPYTTRGDSLHVRLLYKGAPRPGAQVELWEKAGRSVTRRLYRTDDEGHATLDVRPGHSYQIDAVVLREPESQAAIEAGVMWESLWANMTFAVPE
ncbi:hypothetical protein OB2597_03332 [Pseudooceanicola batsensis HTCC2597]|uniref:DUF4198 domain-containing protein n=1 Tax=Pseudooceanicola batsensis (strain ATCC BAA-863 / DSM 15984 / KCTC 12145 / HTCC2597) TaxID=252305 RepID=A3TXR0_PSEBH|nr:DUF4198 domain-containing protein [Pseudooceanicola batsensis]EAQ03620.1 hypothetical protein OB2597_03332 [Pseudooceanicola batsensis HTCC2597]